MPFIKKLTVPIVGMNRQFYALDILRGIAALTIIVWHYKNFLRGTDLDGLTAKEIDTSWLLSFFEFIIPTGFFAVALFWMISGFVFMLVYAGQGKGLRASDYAINRFSRLYPLHFATLIYVAGLQILSQSDFNGYQIYQINDGQHFIMQLFFVSAWGFESGNSFNGPVWSVSAEIFTYIVFLIYARWIAVNFLSLAAVFLFSYGLVVVTDLLVFVCLTFFFGGCLVYGVVKAIHNNKPRYGLAFAAVGLCAFTIIDVWLVFIGFSLPYTIRLIGYFGFLILIIALLESDYPQLDLRRFRGIGDITYATYLLHSPLQMTFLMGVAWNLIDLSIVLTAGFAVAYFICVIGISYLVFHYFEKPVQMRIRNLRSKIRISI